MVQLTSQKKINDKSIIVTGAGGSIGSQLCRFLVKMNPYCIILLDHSEFNLYLIEKELSSIKTSTSLAHYTELWGVRWLLEL
mgnify:CR=1 FL=1